MHVIVPGLPRVNVDRPMIAGVHKARFDLSLRQILACASGRLFSNIYQTAHDLVLMFQAAVAASMYFGDSSSAPNIAVLPQ